MSKHHPWTYLSCLYLYQTYVSPINAYYRQADTNISLYR